MADDIARLGYEIDSSQALGAAKNLLTMEAAAGGAATGAARLQTVFRNSNGTFKSASNAAKENADRIQQLADKYNVALSSELRFAQAQKEVAEAIKLGVIAADQKDAVLERLQQQYIATGTSARTMGKGLQASAQHSTNLLFQFQDIGMMLAAGQNPLMLAMQQGTQVAGVFHQMKSSGQSAFSGIKAGLLGLVSPMSLLTIGVIAGGAALVQLGISALTAEDEAKTLEDALGDLSDALSDVEKYNFDNSLDGMHASAVVIRDEFINILAIVDEMNANALQKSLDNLREQVGLYDAIKKNITAASLAAQTGVDAPAFNFLGLDNLNEALFVLKAIREIEGKTRQEILKSVEATSEKLWLRGVLNDQVKAFLANVATELQLDKEILDTAKARNDRIEEGRRRLAEVLGITGNISAETSEWERRMAGVRVEIGAIAAAIASLGGGAISAAAKRTEIEALRAGQSVKAAAVAASEFKKNLEIDAQVAGLESRFGVIGKAVGAMVRGQAEYNRELDRTLDAEREAAIQREKDAKKGGKSYVKDRDAFIASLQTERETLEMWRSEQLVLLAQYNDAELAAIGGKNEAKLRLEREYHERLGELQQQDRDRSLGVYSGLFGNMAALAKAGGEKTFAVWKAFSIAQATIDSYRAYTQVLADPFFTGRPFMRAIAAASVLAGGLAQVQQISSTSIGGGSGGGGGGGAPVGASTAAQAEPERVTRIIVDGDDWARSLVEPLVRQIYEASEDGSRVIVGR